MLSIRSNICLSVILLYHIGFLSAQDLLYLDGSGAVANLTIQSGADVYVEGGFVANSVAGGMELDGSLYVGITSGSITANWTDNMASSSVLNTSSGTVYLQSNNAQNVYGPSTKFYNLYLNNTSANSSGIQLLSNIETLNTLTFNDGVLYANSYVMYVSNNAGNAVTYGPSNNSSYSNSWIVALYSSGKLDRLVTAANTYDFPVGSAAAPQLLQASTSATFAGITRFSSSWESAIPGGTSPISFSECGTPYNQLSAGGEWHLRPANGGSYGTGSISAGNVSLIGWGLSTFTPLIDNQFALVVRAEGNNLLSGWTIPTPSCSSLAPYNTAGRIVSSNQVKRNNLTVFSDATSQLAIAMSNVILPLELLSFNGHNAGDVNVLNWETASEYNTDFFQLERSESEQNFTGIGQVPAKGISLSENKYSYTDLAPLPGHNYYRLKIFDQDNSFYYSNVVLIEMPAPAFQHSVEISPNPAADVVTLHMFSSMNDRVSLLLFDELGRLMSKRNFELFSGENNLSMDIAALPVATYLLQVQSSRGNAPELFKVVKVH